MGMSYIGVFFGVGLVVIGGALGIARLASSALEGAARQPEALGKLQIMMIIPAAMIEGLGLLALVVALLSALALNGGVASQSSERAPAAAAATH